MTSKTVRDLRTQNLLRILKKEKEKKKPEKKETRTTMLRRSGPRPRSKSREKPWKVTTTKF